MANMTGSPLSDVGTSDECLTCGELDGVEGECPKSKRPCGHHCNCSWIHDCCHWCGVEFLGDGEERWPEAAVDG